MRSDIASILCLLAFTVSSVTASSSYSSVSNTIISANATSTATFHALNTTSIIKTSTKTTLKTTSKTKSTSKVTSKSSPKVSSAPNPMLSIKTRSRSKVKSSTKTTSKTKSTVKGASATPAPFQISNSEYHNSWSVDLYFDLLDPRASNTTHCVAGDFGEMRLNEWVKCNDTTFSFRIDNWLANGALGWSLSLKHQYRFAGEACVSPGGPNCVTTLAHMNTTFPEGGCDAMGSECTSWESIMGAFGFHLPGTIEGPVDSICKGGVCKKY
ncbi:hypothetical protein MBLNU459_g3831t3 [Dothideomycetes sp. NU459]